MSLLVTPPEPFDTTQVCQGLLGFANTVTLYPWPLVTLVGKTNVPSAVIARSSPLLSSRVSPIPTMPVTVPPMAWVSVVQSMATEVMFELTIVPEPAVTRQVCDGPVGWLAIDTA